MPSPKVILRYCRGPALAILPYCLASKALLDRPRCAKNVLNCIPKDHRFQRVGRYPPTVVAPDFRKKLQNCNDDARVDSFDTRTVMCPTQLQSNQGHHPYRSREVRFLFFAAWLSFLQFQMLCCRTTREGNSANNTVTGSIRKTVGISILVSLDPALASSSR